LPWKTALYLATIRTPAFAVKTYSAWYDLGGLFDGVLDPPK
jgi:hypothetical protein